MILDGCTLQGSCGNEMWPGIEVWGDAQAHQQEENGSYLQGYVELKNGATIENAQCAIRLHNPLVSGTSGGIVHASDAVFRNNAMAVEAVDYTNHFTMGQRELDYNGWFHNCSFIVDANYIPQSTFHSHAALSDIRGIVFKGCSFSANRSIDGVDQFCAGIAAYNASFVVTDYCDSQMTPCPSGSLTRSSFNGFHRGVGAVNDGQSTRSFIVRDSDFSGNDIGVFALNTPMASTVGNTFAIGGLADCSYGVYLEGVSLCRVEENEFTKTPGTSSVTYGVAVKNSQAASDIYLNQFSDLSCANLAVGRNAIVTEYGREPSITTGLTYTCNTNEDNIVDFRVVDDGDLSGIQPIQGSTSIAAGNTFSGSSWHIHNDGDYTLSYYYNASDPDQIPSSSKLYHVSATASSGGNRCMSHYGSSPMKLSPSGIDSLASQWAEARAAYEKLRQAYETQVGDGMDDSEAEPLLAEMTEMAHRATEVAGDIIRSLANDPGSDAAELRRWLAALGCPETDRIAVASLLEQGDTDEALSHALAMDGKYGPKQLDPVEHKAYLRLVSLYAELKQSGRNAFELTDEELAMVEKTFAERNGQASRLAQALLEGTGRRQDLLLCPPDIIDEYRYQSEGTDSRSDGVKEDVSPQFSVSVIPSPTKDKASIQYSLPDGTLHASFALYSMTGMRVMSLELDGRQKSKSIDLNDIPAGVYTYVVHCDGLAKTGKMVVVE